MFLDLLSPLTPYSSQLFHIVHKNSSHERKTTIFFDVKDTIKFSSKSINTCWSCLQSVAEKIQNCSQCKIAHYCSVTCQKKDWEFHQLECPQFKLKFSDLKTAIKGQDVTESTTQKELSAQNELPGDVVQVSTARSTPLCEQELLLIKKEKLSKVEKEHRQKCKLLESLTEQSSRKEKIILEREIVGFEIDRFRLIFEIFEDQVITWKHQTKDDGSKLARIGKKNGQQVLATSIVTRQAELISQFEKFIKTEMQLALYDLQNVFSRRSKKYSVGSPEEEQCCIVRCHELRVIGYRRKAQLLTIFKRKHEVFLPLDSSFAQNNSELDRIQKFIEKYEPLVRQEKEKLSTEMVSYCECCETVD